jgi:hypothetical protein
VAILGSFQTRIGSPTRLESEKFHGFQVNERREAAGSLLPRPQKPRKSAATSRSEGEVSRFRHSVRNFSVPHRNDFSVSGAAEIQHPLMQRLAQVSGGAAELRGAREEFEGCERF